MSETNLNAADPVETEIDAAIRLWVATEGGGIRQFCLDQAYVWDQLAIKATSDAEEVRCLKRAVAWRIKAKMG